MAHFISLFGSAVCPAHGASMHVEVSLYHPVAPNDAPQLTMAMPGEARELEVFTLVSNLVALHPAADPDLADPERGTALLEHWCPTCEANRWVRLRLSTTASGRARVDAPEVVVPSAEALRGAEWVDHEVLWSLLGRGPAWPSPLPAETLATALRALDD